MVEKIRAGIKKLPNAEGLSFPSYMTPGSAGMDLCAAVDTNVTMDVGETALIPTGLSISLPDGYEAQVRPRSGLALKYGVTVLNAPGTVDADYRGEIKIILINLGQVPFLVRRGERIAQMIVSKVVKVEWDERESLDHTKRSEGGFGHTG